MPARTLSALAASLGGAPQRVVLWLRNDLRLHDSAVFHQATMLVEQGPCEVQALSPEQWVCVQVGACTQPLLVLDLPYLPV